MRDIQVTVDSFKKFTGNIFTIDNIEDLTIFGNENRKCQFTAKLFSKIILERKHADHPIEWDVYLTSVFIGGYKQEQYARPGCLFDNVKQRWNGEGIRPPLGVTGTVYNQNKEENGMPKATYSIHHRTDTSALAATGNYGPPWESGQPIPHYDINNDASSFIDYYTDASGDIISDSFYNVFSEGNETVHAFVIKIKDQTGKVYTSNNTGGIPRIIDIWKGSEGSETIFPSNILKGKIVLNNIREQRRDGFNLSGTKIEENVVDNNDQKGQLTVQDYMPFIYTENQEPIYLTTLEGGHKISDITIDITDQNGYSIWHPAHVSQMRHKFGIDANPPTASRRLIFKLTYKPRIKQNNKLLDSLNILNDNIMQLVE
tara:strand:- start:2659 stop:3774 length:1116 start_codon:yes stop_codon:yes gene_type:complete